MGGVFPFPIWKRLAPLFEIPERLTHLVYIDWRTWEVPCSKLVEMRTQKLRGFRAEEVRNYLEETRDLRDERMAAYYMNGNGPGAVV